MMSMVVGFGLAIVAIFWYLNRSVVPVVSTGGSVGTPHACSTRLILARLVDVAMPYGSHAGAC